MIQLKAPDMFQPRAVTLICIVLFAAAVRVLPHPDNFTPIAALALRVRLTARRLLRLDR